MKRSSTEDHPRDASKPDFHYVYILRSQSDPTKVYIGSTANLRSRMRSHNWGMSPHTARFKPWALTTYFAFDDKQRAQDFERYLKSGSGRAFLHKRLA